jgi:tetratricopeptide (TPR) repeat protein
MSIKDVSKIPKNLYEYIAKVINESGDDLAAAILYCVAKTRTGWLYRDQLKILRELLKKEGILKGSGRYEKLLAKLNESFGIRHDVWRDVITLDTERLPRSIISSAEMDVVRRIKKYGEGLTRLTKEACKESLNHIKIMEASEAANLAKRALENFPDLSEDVFRIALGEKGDKRDLILDVIAIEAPEPLMNIEIDKAEKLAYEIKAPNAGAVLFGRLASHYRDLAEKDERFLPDLATTLNNLGNALSRKGSLDDAIERYEEALNIYRDLAEKDKRFLPDLATTLNNLGNALSRKGSLDDAIERYEEALNIYRDLAEKDKRFLPDLARTLNNLGVALSDKGSLDDAIDKLEEALKIYRDLAEKDKRILPDLARTLNNLGVALSRKGSLDDAIERYEDALKVMEPLSDRPWLWDIISGSHIGIALLERDKKGAVEHLCAALKMLTDERAPKTPTSKWLLEICIFLLNEISEELIPEECRSKLEFLVNKISS